MVGRETASHLLQLVIARLDRLPVWTHVDFIWHASTLAKIAWAAGCNDIVPAGFAAARARDQMVKCQVMR